MKRVIFFGSFFFVSLTLQAQENYIVVEGDSLWAIAKIFYSNPLMWQEIYKANANALKDPHLIYPNQVLVLPRAPEIKAEGRETELKSQQVEEPYKAPGPLLQQTPQEITSESLASPVPVEIPSQEEKERNRQQKKKTSHSYDGKIIAARESNRIMYAQGDGVTINLGLKDGLVDGDELLIVRRAERIAGGRSKETLWQFKELGKLKVIVAHEASADCEITLSHEPIELGDGVLKQSDPN